MSPAPDQDAPVGVTCCCQLHVDMLRDLTEAVTEVAGRLFDLPPRVTPGTGMSPGADT